MQHITVLIFVYIYGFQSFDDDDDGLRDFDDKLNEEQELLVKIWRYFG